MGDGDGGRWGLQTNGFEPTLEPLQPGASLTCVQRPHPPTAFALAGKIDLRCNKVWICTDVGGLPTNTNTTQQQLSTTVALPPLITH
jgi:hypothetical protein